MDVRKLAPGHTAPVGSDYISLARTGNGKIELTALIGGDGGPLQTLGTYDSADDAQRAGVQWFVGRGGGLLYIEVPYANRT